MTTIKSYSDVQQSCKLAKMLPLESADMMYHSVENEYGTGAFVATSKVITNGFKNDDFYIDDIPCWSLAALLGVLPEPNIFKADGLWHIFCDNNDSCVNGFDNPIDACYELILKLNELNLL